MSGLVCQRVFAHLLSGELWRRGHDRRSSGRADGAQDQRIASAVSLPATIGLIRLDWPTGRYLCPSSMLLHYMSLRIFSQCRIAALIYTACCCRSFCLLLFLAISPYFSSLCNLPYFLMKFGYSLESTRAHTHTHTHTCVFTWSTIK